MNDHGGSACFDKTFQIQMDKSNGRWEGKILWIEMDKEIEFHNSMQLIMPLDQAVKYGKPVPRSQNTLKES